MDPHHLLYLPSPISYCIICITPYASVAILIACSIRSHELSYDGTRDAGTVLSVSVFGSLETRSGNLLIDFRASGMWLWPYWLLAVRVISERRLELGKRVYCKILGQRPTTPLDPLPLLPPPFPKCTGQLIDRQTEQHNDNKIGPVPKGPLCDRV